MAEVVSLKSFGSLSNGIFFNICKTLDIKTLLRLGSTCKELYQWINNQDYWKAKCISADMVQKKSKKNQKRNITNWKEFYISNYKKMCTICGVRVGKRFRVDNKIWCTVCSNTHPDGYVLVGDLMKEYNLSITDFSMIKDRMVHRHTDRATNHRRCLIKRKEVLEHVVNNPKGKRPRPRWNSTLSKKGLKKLRLHDEDNGVIMKYGYGLDDICERFW